MGKNGDPGAQFSRENGAPLSWEYGDPGGGPIFPVEWGPLWENWDPLYTCTYGDPLQSFVFLIKQVRYILTYTEKKQHISTVSYIIYMYSISNK